jgi:hypothetical protein
MTLRVNGTVQGGSLVVTARGKTGVIPFPPESVELLALVKGGESYLSLLPTVDFTEVGYNSWQLRIPTEDLAPGMYHAEALALADGGDQQAVRQFTFTVLASLVPAPPADAAPGVLDLVMVQGDDFTQTLNFVNAAGDPLNLTTYSAYAARVRGVTGSEFADFTIDSTDEAGGVLIISLDELQTVNLPRACEWDLQWRNPLNQLRTVLAGEVTVRPQVTP